MTTVKHFHSAMTGAPVLSGTAGSLIAVLDACLVNGFGLKTADSVVVSGGVGTATFSAGHSFEPDVIALVAGATPSGLNGETRVLNTATNVITFDATGIADGTATGTITFKIAPAGWAKPFAGTNLGVYRSSDVTGSRPFLRVDASSGRSARVVGYESMDDVDAGSGPFPTSAQVSGGGYWPTASDASTSARAWTLFSDSKTFWLHMHTSATGSGISGSVWGFGDCASYKSGDAYSGVLWCHDGEFSANSSNPGYSVEFVSHTGVDKAFMPRSFTGLGGSCLLLRSAESYFNGASSSGAMSSPIVPRYPNGTNNGLLLTRELLVEPGQALRGVARGFLLTPQNCHAAFQWRDKLIGQGSYAGRKLMAIKCGAPNGSTSNGVVFFDITGPWG